MSSNIRVSKTMSDSWPQLDGSNQSQLFTLSFPVDHAADSTFFKRVFFTEKLASQRNFQAKWNILNYFVISDFKKVKRNSDVTRMETKKKPVPAHCAAQVWPNRCIDIRLDNRHDSLHHLHTFASSEWKQHFSFIQVHLLNMQMPQFIF